MVAHSSSLRPHYLGLFPMLPSILAVALIFLFAPSAFSHDLEEGGTSKNVPPGAADSVRKSRLAKSLQPAESVLTVRHDYGDISDYDAHSNVVYEVSLLKLALEKSREEFGPFELVGVDKGYMTHARAKELMRSKHIENYVKVFGYSTNDIVRNQLDFADTPVYLGLMSYRTCFSSIDNRKKLSKVNSLDAFTSLIQATGVGWVDTDILKANFIEVREVPNVRAIYEMVARQRVDLFCRGANEALRDFEENKHIGGLMYDTTLAMYYPNPHFFHVHKDNSELRKRISLGLKEAYKDGSLQKLWRDVFGKSVSFVGFEGRRVFELQNPLVKGIPVEYQSYEFYRPGGQVPGRAPGDAQP